MRSNHKATLCLLVFLLCLTLLLHYPGALGHEAGSDTTFIHSLTGSLLSNGRALWVVSPYSYFGLFALSYPSAIPFLLVSISSLAGVPIEGSILLCGIVFALVGTLSAFLATRALKQDDRLALVVTFLFAVSPLLIHDTSWVGSSRGFVATMVPVMFLLLLRHMRSRDPRALLLFGVFVVTALAIHRMGALIVFVLVAYLFVIPFHRVTQQLRFTLLRYEKTFRLTSMGVSLGAFVGLFYLQFLYPGFSGVNVVDQYGTGAFFTGTGFDVLILNLLISLGGKVGLLLPLAAVGLFRLAWKRPKEDRDKFLLVAALVIIPLLSFRDYISEFLIFLFVLLIAAALFPLPKTTQRRRVAAVIIIGVLLAGSLGFSWVMKDYWKTRYYSDSAIPDELYGTALYVRWESSGSLLSNEGLSAGRITAISGRPVLPIGGASIHWFGPQQLTFGYVNPDLISVRPIPLTSISFRTDEIFDPVNVANAKDDYETIFYNGLGSPLAQTVLARYDVQYLVALNTHMDQFQSYIWRASPFMQNVQVESYVVFDAPTNSIWYLG